MKLFTLVIMFFISVFSASGQEISSTLHIESVNSKGIKKEINGQCVNMSFVSLKNAYGIIIIPAEFLDDAKELKVFLKQESMAEDFVVILSTDQIYLAKFKKLAAFPFFVIREKILNNTGITYPSFVMEETLKLYFPEITAKITLGDVSELKKEIEKNLTE